MQMTYYVRTSQHAHTYIYPSVYTIMQVTTYIMNYTVNPLRVVVAYMHQGNKYVTVRKQIIIAWPLFTL